MFNKLRPRSAYDVVALLGLFVALGTGGAYAANTIGSADVIDESLLSADIKNGEVKNADLATSSVTSAKLYNGSVLNADLGANAVTAPKVLDNALTGDDILESSLGKVGDADTVDGKSSNELSLDFSRSTIQPGYCTGTCFGATEGISWSNPTESEVALGSPARAMIARRLAVSIVDPTTGHAGMTFTLRVAGQDTALSCTFPNDYTAGACSDTIHSVTIPAGSPISIEVQPGTGIGNPEQLVNPAAVGFESLPAS